MRWQKRGWGNKRHSEEVADVEIAAVVAFLCSDDACWLTAQNLPTADGLG